MTALDRSSSKEVARRELTVAELSELEGQELGASAWVAVDQPLIDDFADVTGDHQWIHVSPERAASSPFGTTIAHGLLSLSFVPQFLNEVLIVTDASFGVNYGFERVRFPAPVPSGSRIRGRISVSRVVEFDLGIQVVFNAVVDREGHEKPVCVAEIIARFYGDSA